MHARIITFAALMFFFFLVPASSQGPHQCRHGMQGGMSGATMTKRAEIRVIPMAQFNDDQAAMDKMSELAARLRENRKTLKPKDAPTQAQLQLEAELLDVMDAHLKRARTDEGKSETAVAVQKKLNAMEGQRMCGACHGMGGPPSGE